MTVTPAEASPRVWGIWGGGGWASAGLMEEELVEVFPAREFLSKTMKATRWEFRASSIRGLRRSTQNYSFKASRCLKLRHLSSGPAAAEAGSMTANFLAPGCMSPPNRIPESKLLTEHSKLKRSTEVWDKT